MEENGIKLTGRTLFVTDLDGTLLRRDATLSEFTKTTVNGLIDKGMLFTYATARSGETSSIVTSGLKTSAPRVLYNGAFICGTDGEIISSHTFSERDKDIVRDLIGSGVYPIVYSLQGGKEKFSFIPDKLSRGCAGFIETRKDCVRYNPVSTERELIGGEMFYISCVDERDKLAPFYEKYRREYYCVLSTSVYSGECWLEIMPKKANKADALLELKSMLGCRLVVFGDGKNDIEMFETADESYAVANAVDELKAVATAVIDSNTADGVAKRLKELFGAQK